MITSILIVLIASLLYFTFRGGRASKWTGGLSSRQYLSLLLLTGIVILLAIFNPELKEKVKILKSKLKTHH